MKYPLTSVLFGFAMSCISYTVSAQDASRNTNRNQNLQTEKRMDNYRTLKNMGYEDTAIYQDLGNANFLNKDYETAVFWYTKLKDNSKKAAFTKSYAKRYEHALKQTVTNSSVNHDDSDWMASVRSDYTFKNTAMANTSSKKATNKFRDLNFNRDNELEFVQQQLLSDVKVKISEKDKSQLQNTYKAPIALSPDGTTAYFSKPEYVKPEYGAFSKKELVHKIYRAEKKNGRWKNVQQVAVAPKHASVMHPALSQDGKRLFFASDMPGSFGKYDIYVSAVQRDGSLGVAKNLGRKVNTKKNDLYPHIIEGNTLSFASEGHRGQGGLDVYMTQVNRSNVSLAINLGDDINSDGDEFAVALTSRNGTGYVMSNRDVQSGEVEKVAFSFSELGNDDPRGYNIMEAMNDSQIDYTSSLFEDE